VRPDPDCPASVPDACILGSKLFCCPLYGFHKLCSLRYFTSWSLLFYIVFLPCYFAVPFKNDVVRGVLWEISVFIAPVSTCQMLLAPEFSRFIISKVRATTSFPVVELLASFQVGWIALAIVHFVLHLLPTVLLVTLTSVPHPPAMAATGLMLALLLVYACVLFAIWRIDPLENYFLMSKSQRVKVRRVSSKLARSSFMLLSAGFSGCCRGPVFQRAAERTFVRVLAMSKG
jgi:hypothetical protein